jgi:hypothetical protein
MHVEVVKIEVVEHGNADALEIAMIGDYQSIIRKGQFKSVSEAYLLRKNGTEYN